MIPFTRGGALRMRLSGGALAITLGLVPTADAQPPAPPAAGDAAPTVTINVRTIDPHSFKATAVRVPSVEMPAISAFTRVCDAL